MPVFRFQNALRSSFESISCILGIYTNMVIIMIIVHILEMIPRCNFYANHVGKKTSVCATQFNAADVNTRKVKNRVQYENHGCFYNYNICVVKLVQCRKFDAHNKEETSRLGFIFLSKLFDSYKTRSQSFQLSASQNILGSMSHRFISLLLLFPNYSIFILKL